MKKILYASLIVLGSYCFSSDKPLGQFWTSGPKKMQLGSVATNSPSAGLGHFSEFEDSAFTRRNNDKLAKDVQVRRLHALLKSELNLNETEIAQFDRLLNRSASLEPMIMREQVLPTHIVIKEGTSPVPLPAKIVIVSAAVLNLERLAKGIWNFKWKQQEERAIEEHLAQNPDPEVRKVTHE